MRMHSKSARVLEDLFHTYNADPRVLADLAAYLRALRALHSGSTPDSAPIPLRRRDLLSQSEELLASLRWDATRGRSFLEQHFQLASRQQLSDEQLLQFNMLLEEELLQSSRIASHS